MMLLTQVQSNYNLEATDLSTTTMKIKSQDHQVKIKCRKSQSGRRRTLLQYLTIGVLLVILSQNPEFATAKTSDNNNKREIEQDKGKFSSFLISYRKIFFLCYFSTC